MDKSLVWPQGEIKTPPLLHAARVEAGVLLRQLQGGAKLGVPHSRPMPGIGARCQKCASCGRRRDVADHLSTPS
jgi:hypothetical protein